MIYEIVKRYYEKKVYKKEDVKKFVASGRITAEQFKEITGESYKA